MEFKARGNRFYSQGKTAEAIAAYSTGIDRVEENGYDEAAVEDKGCVPQLYANRSMVHLDMCKVDEALQDAECAIEANPEYGKAYLRRAAVLLDLFNFKEAISDLDKAEELEPGLAPEGCEGRLRALGKKWVPNCYLKKQIELRKKHQCDFVLQLELQGGEEIVESVNIPKIDEMFKR